MTKEEITPDWLTQALRTRWQGVEVGEIEYENVILGSATKIRLRVTYKTTGSNNALPETMWIKLGLEDFQKAVESTLGVYSTEVVVYSQVLKRYQANTPDCYFSATQADPPQGVLILEDLVNRQVRFGIATTPMSLDQVSKGLETLAAFHGKSWDDPALNHIQGIQPVLGAGIRLFFEQWVRESPRLFKSPRGFSVPVRLHDSDKLHAGFEAYKKFIRQGAQCFLHGDTHIGNAYTEPDGSLGFLDWQIACTGKWVHDFSYFLITALDIPDRRYGEKDLLAHYLERLRKDSDVAVPGFNDAWEDYRRSAFYGFLAWLGNGDEFQPAEVNTACLSRYGAAMIDLDTYKALGVY